MNREACYRILGLPPGATEKQLKAAFRRLAMEYHPDHNPSPGAKKRFQEIKAAYEYLLEQPAHEPDTDPAGTYEDWVAAEVYRRERERMRRHAQARREQKAREEAYFERPEWHDPLLFLRYTARVIVLILVLAAIVLPLLLVGKGDLLSPLATLFFLVVGLILAVYIYQQRASWFRLGSFRTTRQDLLEWLWPKRGPVTGERCCYADGSEADGKPYRIELLKILDIKVSSFGVLNHGAKYRNKVKRVTIPRSVKAQRFHRFSSVVKLIFILSGLLFFPVDSLLWRFLAGMMAGGTVSVLMLWLAGVRSKVSYLLTPALLIKIGAWILVLCLVSRFGPGFSVETTGYVKIAVAGLLFFLDMAFDLLLGFFPFYARLFRPLLPQGAVLSSLYREGYQNNLELPFYSVLFPLYKWLF